MILSEKFKPRLYQEKLLGTCSENNSLVVLPTGLGKTAIAFMLAANRLTRYPESKIVMLAPTKPLVEQHLVSFSKYLNFPKSDFQLFTGAIEPEKRIELYKQSKFIFSTPQTIENDLIARRLSLKDVSLLIIDEAHRAVGDYAYNFVAKRYHDESFNELILALTASPGSDKEKIDEIISNLFIEKIEVKTENDSDVMPYVQKTDLKWIPVELPERILNVKKFLDECYNSKLRGIKELGFLNSTQMANLTKRELLGIMSGLQKELVSGNRAIEILKGVSLAAEAMKVSHAIELLETQGIDSLFSYMEDLIKQSKTSKTKAIQNLVLDYNFRSSYVLTKNLHIEGIEHPKLKALVDILKSEFGIDDCNKSFQNEQKNEQKILSKKIIIFTQFRDSGKSIVEKINLIKGIDAKLFVGQGKKSGTGLTQKKQIEMLEDFRNSKFNVIVMTSVGEEGLDIPQVDSVIFYEPIPSAIRTVQRRGRTGRLDEGKVIILYAKQTRDEVYLWVAKRKEQKMHKILQDLKKESSLNINIKKINTELDKNQKTLTDNFENSDKSKSINLETEVKRLKIIADVREKGSNIMKSLLNQDVDIELKKLDLGDYVLAEKVVVEFKTIPDFLTSIIDNRLISQLKSLKEHYYNPLLIIQGTEDMYSLRNIHPNVIYGIIATITISFGIPIIQTKDYKETASILRTIANREQNKENKRFSFHSSKPMSKKEQLEFVVSSLPGIGSTLAEPLLSKFKTIKNLVNSEIDELRKVDLIGEKKANDLKELFDYEYK
jgi:ERCC4-related helicase